MHNLSREILEEIFIKPIRFALLLDDQFPTYLQAVPGPVIKEQDSERARGLFELCRSKGWLCDVDNRAQVASKFEDDNHLHQSDLLILDFHLDPSATADPSKALGIIQKLSKSNHFNLVLVYTSEQPLSVIRDIGYSLGSGGEVPSKESAAGAYIDSIEDSIFDKLVESVNNDMLGKYLSNESMMNEALDTRRILSENNAKLAIHSEILKLLCSKHFEFRISEDIYSKRPSKAVVAGNFKSGSGIKWLVCENVFIAVANKKEILPADVLEQLQLGLTAWNPTVLQVMMIHARSILEKAGTVSDHQVLSDPARQAGWLLPILLAGTPSDKSRELRYLYHRLFTRLIDTIGPSVANLGERLIVSQNGSAIYSAKILARASSFKDREIYHALNEHLCAEDHPDGSMTTGVVFQDENSKEFWLCSTPECDLVPGRKTGGHIDPWLPITAIKLKVINKEPSVIENLQIAERGNHIFLRHGGKSIVLEVFEPQSRQMQIDSILLENEGVITSQRFCGSRVSMGPDHKLTLLSCTFSVLGRLRVAYANRLLAASGTQRARIGVDFVNMPLPIKPKSFARNGSYYKYMSGDQSDSFSASDRTWINTSASATGTALPICVPAAIKPPENTNESGND